MSRHPTLRLALALVDTMRVLFASRADLALENLALRQQLALYQRDPQRQRRRLTCFDRAFWVALQENFERWAEVLVIVKPETVIRWHRQGFRYYWKWRSKRRRPGRPAVDEEIRALIRQLALDNPTWGAPKVHKEIVRLGFEVSERTVARYLPMRPPSPEAVKRWRRFLRNHRDAIAAMDFFVVPTAGFRLLYAFFVIHHDRHRILHFNVTEHPTAQWVCQQLREAFPYGEAPRYLICDRDSTFNGEVRGTLASMGVKVKRTSVKKPWQNGVAERWIGSVRRELLDHVVVLGEAHFRRLGLEYVRYYNDDRLHSTLEGDAPHHRPIEARPSFDAEVVALPRCGGLHHRYQWRDAA